jgi:hypothetical protein
VEEAAGEMRTVPSSCAMSWPNLYAMVDLSREKSNRVFDELANWEAVLQGSSLADPAPATKAKRERVDASVKSGEAV